MVAPYDVAARLPELRAISDDWLAAKRQRERQFSIGFFDDAYLKRFPCAIVEQVTHRGVGYSVVT
jgi:phosphatidylglycerol lysyltransferase